MTELAAVKHDIHSLRQDFKNHQVLTNEQQVITNHKIDDTNHKVDESNHKIDELKDSIDDIKRNQQEINNNQQRILLILAGDGIDEKSGIVKRVSAIEEFIEGIKSTKSYINGNVTAAIFIISSIGGVLAFFIMIYNFFKK